MEAKLDNPLTAQWWTRFFQDIGMSEADSRAYVRTLAHYEISLRNLPSLDHETLASLDMTDENHRWSVLEGINSVLDELGEEFIIVRLNPNGKLGRSVFTRAFFVNVPARIPVSEDEKTVLKPLIQERYFALLKQLSQGCRLDALEPALSTARIHFERRKAPLASLFEQCQIDPAEQDAVTATIVLEVLRSSSREA